MLQEVPTNISGFAAFVFGLISFISPCVLPLMPGYVSFISGKSIDGLIQEGKESKRRINPAILASSIAFVIGFSIVFIALGASATLIGQFLAKNFLLFAKIAGILIIIFGLHLAGLLPIRLLYREKRIQLNIRPAGFAGAVLIGMAFAFGWTPCIGPILGSILLLASQEQSVMSGVYLLGLYSLGLGIPFILTAIALDQFFRFFEKIRKYFHAIEIASGLLLVGIGLLIVFNKLSIIAYYFVKILPWEGWY